MPERSEQLHREPRHSRREYVKALRGHHNAMRYLPALFLYNIDVNTILVNLTCYATHVLHVSDGDALKLSLVLMLLTGLFIVPAARAAGRFGMKPVITGGLVLIAVGAAGALVVQTAAEVVPLLVIAGIGNDCYNALSWPLPTTLIPSERVGVFAGLKSSAESLSAFFSSFLAAGRVALWGYRSIFLILLVAVAASLVALGAVSEGVADSLADPAPYPAPAAGM